MHRILSKYKYTLLICGFILTSACQTKREAEKPPKDLISEQKMGQILADVLLIENYLNNSISPNVRKIELNSYPLINKKYNLTDSQAYFSYQYYLNDPEQFNKVLGYTKDTLESIVNRLNTSQKGEEN